MPFIFPSLPAKITISLASSAVSPPSTPGFDTPGQYAAYFLLFYLKITVKITFKASSFTLR